MKTGKYIILITFFAGILFITGCKTTEPVPYDFTIEEDKTAAVYFKTGNPGVELISYSGEYLPDAAKNTCWNPINFPAGEKLGMILHVYYSQSGNSSGGLLVALATAAIASSRTINQDVNFTCPSLDPGSTYEMEFRKGAGVKGKNSIIIKNLAANRIDYQYDFE